MKALLVEDDAADVTLFRVALESVQASVDLSVADDGEKALEFLHREAKSAGASRPDFILLDLNLPRMGGLEVLGELKNDPDLRCIPVIVLTSSRGAGEVARAYELQAAAYFVKPLSGFDDVVHAIVRFMSTAELPAGGDPGPSGAARFAGAVAESLGTDAPIEFPSDVAMVVDASGRIAMVNRETGRAFGEEWVDSAGEAGARRREFGPVSAGAALDQALANLGPILRESRAQIRRGELPTVTAEYPLLVELFQNLVGNALKFCAGSGTWIEIDARRSGTEWVFSVADNGLGIDHKYFDRVLHLFRRLTQGNGGPGTGGLTLCERIVERLGGRIWVESSPGAGAAFFFAVPDPLEAFPRRLPPTDDAA